MPRVAVILSGCGVFDGSEIHESVLTLYFLSVAGADVQCFAPDRPQTKVVHHTDQSESTTETRNCLVEAARIARGDILALAEAKVSDFDAAIFPGGFGAATSLCDFASAGKDHHVGEDVLLFAQAMAQAKKPMGFLCISPVLIPAIYGEAVQVTIGHDADVAGALNAMGCCHVDANVEDVVIDKQHKVVTTPAYMLGQSIAEVAQGIEKCIKAVLALAE